MNRLIDEKEPVFLGEFMLKMFCRNQMQTFFQPFSQQANRHEMIGHGLQMTTHTSRVNGHMTQTKKHQQPQKRLRLQNMERWEG